MAEPSTPAIFDRRFAKSLWRLTCVYWRSPDAKRGGLLLALAVALELATVGAQLLLADGQRRIFDALQNVDAGAFFAAIGIFLAMALGFVATSTLRIYVRQMVEIRWRTGLTSHYLSGWIRPTAYCQEKLHQEADNPDQRISEDVREYVASALGLSLSLLSAVVTLVSFGGLLWSLSGDWAVEVAGLEVRIPGLMLWVAIVYALFATWITHRVGRPLVPINFDRQRVEADFRFDLVRFRENVEPVAFARGEGMVRSGALTRFAAIVGNWWQLIRAQRNLTLLTTGIGEVNGVVPLLVAAPAFFAGELTLGGVAQTRIAYGQVSGALSWVVNAYQEIARWRASIERLTSFTEAMESTEVEICEAHRIQLDETPEKAIRISDLRVELPDGAVLLDDVDATIARGDRIALLGPLGTGKTALLRAIAGIWPFGKGRIELPSGDRVFILPPRPFLTIGTLRAAIAFPSPPETFPDDKIREYLSLLDLGHLASRLDVVDHWERVLSTGEEQRLGLVRTLLQKPEWILLDNATGSLDEASEERIYALLAEHLPDSAVLSIAHRPGLARFHAHRWTFAPGPPGTPATFATG